jgi:bifunctional DNA-binding transcriptional regulator/antitoxin component of YhaV-PrlF toxin-antitoxin module
MEPREIRSTSKVTSKLQVTIPKAIADRLGIRPGDEIAWLPAGRGVRVVLPGEGRRAAAAERERLVAAAWERQRAREAAAPAVSPVEERGWTRDDLYEDRGGRAR